MMDGHCHRYSTASSIMCQHTVTRFSPCQALNHYLQVTIKPQSLTGPLLLITFCAGALDIATYWNFGTFASNQTGNTFILITILTGLHPATADLSLTGASLLAFLVFAFIFARASVYGSPRHTTRWWLLFSFAVQNTFLVLPAALITGRKVPVQGSLAWLLLGLLAASSGIQVVMARTSGNPEIPSAMLTSPYIDFFVDPGLFAPPQRPGSRSRNVRLLYICSLVGGGFVGGGIHKLGGTLPVLWLVVALRLATMIWVCLLDRKGLDQDTEAHEIVARCV
ncbi:hypothetical protein C343_02239 [Cryptococcus neoformans C23]|uniref:DUF1275 domain protein n=1 Tax=Cryptococcus neoformans (strain H99 / ATCC 208821 / CBS 10515 / FGSC 9487) TaxID=235443 RepID=J9VI94_CRYN9|nr:hypothetical protein CNAG_06911 [Cryptococcus neoformans var. grubii H99]AUB23782.1 hypothetical protein CKF44_06911 [Cryptococcus neoformans var. grubii]OWZ33669.1 hypothetical protein C347_02308 [Cryptococcus neoformans var. grubii AD2-60a]OWZ45769.1 hypothetical protein C343_02239 [Cryptococcus neoformans var. grubii C23]OXC85674.1 hypothetical protein C344_02041 [Cryptococcus neoformans var. grubii AD1-7a]OXG43626.1 hypothetical protein C359_01462 [Cryptococcus neoformans var. grubii Bt|eukprot:XP_012048007.1 hypothetical protein CNAG_06911 [Cryptococcus neoformans var. grubii H99]